jgi:membrane fusion protein, type I secretion system
MSLKSFLQKTVAKAGEVRATEPASKDSVIRFGVMVLAIGLGGFILWGSFVPLAKGVIAPGTIAVDGKRKTIQHLEGGIVHAIHVRDGDMVSAGDILLELDQTQAGAQRDLLEVRYFTNLAILDRLKAEREENADISFSTPFMERANVSTIQEIMAVQIDLFGARRQQMEGQTSILEQRVGQLESQIEGLVSEREARETEIALTREELTRTRSLQERGLIAMPQVWEQEKALAQLEGAIGRIRADIGAAQVAIGEARLEIIQIVLTHRQEIAEQSLVVQVEVLELREQLVAVEDVIERTLIRAPQDGTVFGLNVFTVGGVVPPASPVMEIVPANDRLVVEAQIKATDVDNIENGMPVRVQFVSFKSRSTPTLNGILEFITADALVNEQTNENFYVARIGISEAELSRLGSLNVVPGMPVEVLIEAGTRTAFQYLSEPLSDVVRRSMTEE